MHRSVDRAFGCVRTGKAGQVTFHENRCQMRAMSEEEIRRYVATGEPMDKAGAYGIQGNVRFLLTKSMATIIML